MKHDSATIQLLSAYAFLFFLVSIGAYFWEVFLYLILYDSLVNRGFFHGPWLPVYGSGAVLLSFLLSHLFPYTKISYRTHTRSYLAIFLCSATSACIVEYLLGAYLDWRYQIRYWDYSTFPFHLHGHVCLYSFLGFGIGGLLLYRFLFPAIFSFCRTHTLHTTIKILLPLWILFLSDFIYSCYKPNTGSNITFPVSVLLKIRSNFSG